MDFLERIGPFLGIAAFLGFSLLAFLLIGQARELRRLREWAGRAPERAKEADEAAAAAAEARGQLAEEEGPGVRERVRERLAPAWDAIDRRSPVDPPWLFAVLLAGVIAAGVLTSGFGLLGEDEPVRERGERRAQGGNRGEGGRREERERPPRVAVLNATAVQNETGTVEAVPGLAGVIAETVVEPAGFRVRTTDTALTGSEVTVVMYEEGNEEDAREFASAIEEQLGAVEIEPMTPEVRDLAAGAELALLVGADNDDFVAPLAQ
ncbi:MAG TPA: LytR C-terminal domain-containing protein [Solirubrobacterales bacterium]|jgi:hypothetical protein